MPVVDPGFFRGWFNSKGVGANLLFGYFFPENYWKMTEIRPIGWGFLEPSLRSANLHHGSFIQSLNGTRKKNGLHYFMFSFHAATYVGTLMGLILYQLYQSLSRSQSQSLSYISSVGLDRHLIEICGTNSKC